MFKSSQEFTFTVTNSGVPYEVVGQLVFQATELNTTGSLCTDQELVSFTELLNGSLPVPEYWTLETMSQHIFQYAKPLFTTLYSLNLYLSEYPQKVVEYFSDYSDIEGDVLELEEIG